MGGAEGGRSESGSEGGERLPTDFGEVGASLGFIPGLPLRFWLSLGTRHLRAVVIVIL
jgi:hypothetical protein